jgi:hypothetical protein
MAAPATADAIRDVNTRYLIDFDHGVVEVERPVRHQGIYKRDVRVGHNVWDRLWRVLPARYHGG